MVHHWQGGGLGLGSFEGILLFLFLVDFDQPGHGKGGKATKPKTAGVEAQGTSDNASIFGIYKYPFC